MTPSRIPGSSVSAGAAVPLKSKLMTASENLGIINTRRIGGSSTSQLRIRLRMKIPTRVHVSAESRPSFGLM